VGICQETKTPPHRKRDVATPAAHCVNLCYALGNMDCKNKLYFGDNLKILREHVPDASVDLIYLDPPFNSSATYNVLFKEKSGEESVAQITAIEDTWQWGTEPEAVCREILESGACVLAGAQSRGTRQR
jgi:16S rRNA G966 N2-methylase RsmD